MIVVYRECNEEVLGYGEPENGALKMTISQNFLYLK